MRIDGNQVRRAVLAALLLSAFTGIAAADTTPLHGESADGVLLFASDDGRFKWSLDGRVNLDGLFFVEDKNPLGDGVQLRRARLALKTVLWGDWYAEMDVDFVEEATAMKDVYLRYDNLFNRQGYVRVGNFREPFGLEENTSSRNIQFQERSQATDGFVPGRKMGLEVARFAPRWRAAAGVFGPDITEFETENDDMSWNVTGRVTANFLRDRGQVLHLGVAGSHRQPQFQSGNLRLRTRNEYHVNNYKYVDTDNISNVDTYDLFDAEFAYVNRRLRVQAEYIDVNVKRSGALDELDFGGAYVSASCFLTDDTHPYVWQDGEFGRLVPRAASGAWEVLARYSTVDMTDLDVRGGESTALTLGLNWHANANVRVYNSFVLIDNDEDASARGSVVGNDDFQYYQVRVLLMF
jgi:phosphate-selective porin OprO/OprP